MQYFSLVHVIGSSISFRQNKMSCRKMACIIKICCYIQELLETIKDLQSKLLKERKDKLKLELKIREEVCSEMMKQLVEIEDECR